MKKFLCFVGVLGVLVFGRANFAFCGTVTVTGTTTVFTSIQAGINACLEGGTVSALAGTYNEAVYINKKIALVGVGIPTITASGLGNTNTVTFEGDSTDGAVISGFTITGATGSWPNGNGIFCVIGAKPTITNNTIFGNSWHGITCHNNSFFPIITNNTISKNSRQGIYCENFSSPTIINNIITENGTTNVWFYGIYNDMLYPCTLTIDYNCVWGNGLYGTSNYFNCNHSGHDISANPQFIGANDFHLDSSSPCIDTGSNTAPSIPSTDKDGFPRIVNSTVDIGAYEYQGTVTPTTGSLTITSTTPNAKIYLDDTDTTQVTPATLTTTPGTYTIKLTLSGYKDWYGTATVIADSTTYIYATLTLIPTIRLIPSVIHTQLNGTFTIDVIVGNVSNLMAGEIRLSFDNTRIQGEGITEGTSFLKKNGGMTFFTPDITNGSISVAFAILGGTPPGVSGTGTLFSVLFKTITGTPTSQITYDLVDLRDTDTNPISIPEENQFTAQILPMPASNGSVTVYDADGGFVGTYTTIQAGVDACPVGGTVSALAETYNEAVYINKKIALIGVGTPTITAAGLGDTNTVTFDGTSTDGAIISGFVITEAMGSEPAGNGIYCNNGSPIITNNTISGNNSGICCDFSSPIITNNTISKNSLDGIYCSYSSATITNNAISENYYGINCNYSSLTIINNTMARNFYGISCISSFPTISNNTITENIYVGIECCYTSSPEITNNIIAGNSFFGIYCWENSSPIITNNTIAENSSFGIYCSSSSSPNLTNNIISDNIYGIYCDTDSNPVIDYNCVWKNGPDDSYNYYECTPGIDNITADPQFIEVGDFHLQPISPCINKGTNTAPGLPLTDKDGNSRIVNDIVDIGAYEYQGIPLTTGSLTIISTPPGANIFINGTNTGITTPAQLPLQVGSYTLALMLTNYYAYTTTFTINPGSVTYISGTLIPYPGTFSVLSSPSGANILINGSNTGMTTPAQLPLQIGSYTLALTLTNYYTYTTTFTINPCSVTYISGTLTLITGSISVTSTPDGANIWLDGGTQTQGTTPAILTGIIPGTHTIKLTKQGYCDWFGTVTVPAIIGSTTYLYVSLTPSAELHHFRFTPISDKRVNEPFSIQVIAEDELNRVIMDFYGTATLNDTTGTIIPQVISFAQGIGSVLVTIEKATLTVQIKVQKSGITGTSNSFSVLIPNDKPYYPPEKDNIKIEIESNSFEGDYILDIDQFLEKDKDNIEFANDRFNQDPTMDEIPNSIHKFTARNATQTIEFAEKATITITFSYNPADLKQIDETKLKVYRLVKSGDRWQWIEVPSKVYSFINKITAQIPQMGIYILAGPVIANNFNDFVVFPNPLKKSRDGSIIEFAGLPADVSIRIYDISGNLVKYIENQTADWKWNAGKEVDSGIYIYIIEDKFGNQITGKIGVIR
ncbi:MAG: PEGA domain-containing protein [Nitrospirota bacterium]